MQNIYVSQKPGEAFELNAASASSFLKEGTIINTRIGSNSVWYQNIVFKSDGNIVCIRLLDSYLGNMIMPGTGFAIKQTNEYFEYLFEGVVTGIKADFPAYVTIYVNKADEIINTRVFPRYDTYLASNIRPYWDESPYFSIVTNISLGGVAFVSRHQFDYGEECDVSIYLPGSRMILCKGKVIRRNIKSDYTDYSMQFTEMNEDNSNYLSDYLESLGVKIEKLKSDFFENIKNRL